MNKYAISSRKLDQRRKETLDELNGFLKGLGYLGSLRGEEGSLK